MISIQTKNYRRDIQGLRGFAVLLVLVYHSGVFLSGGFIGVDVFFVVSGFVIAKLLLEEIQETGTVNLVNFFTRRARRLLPTLAFVTVFTLLFSLLILSPFGSQQDVSLTARATALFSVNYFFMLKDTYENLGANPLRHTWSLAIEEQFYFIFPVGIFLISKLLRQKLMSFQKLITIIIVIFGVLSFCLSFVTSIGRGSQIILEVFKTTPERLAFFSMPTRAWEFAVGILSFILIQKIGDILKKFSEWIFILGITSILMAAFLIKSDDNFPGLWSLFPVIGTAFLLISGPQSKASQLIFAGRSMSFLGDISYGLYLWHWPCVVFADVIWQGSIFSKPLAIVISIIPTVITYRFFENPIRLNQKIIGAKVLALGTACVLTPLLGSYFATQATFEVQKHFADINLGWSEKRSAVIDGCYGKIFDEWRTDRCVNRKIDSKGLVLLLGDSQSASASNGLIVAANRLNLDVATASYPGCPMFERPPRDSDVCKQVVNFYFSLIESLKPQVVMLANSGDRYTWEGLEIARSEKDGGGFPQTLADKETSVVQSYTEIIFRILTKAGNVIVLLEAPPVQFSKQISLLKPNVQIVETNLNSQNSREKINRGLSRSLEKISRVAVINVDTSICPTGSCIPTLNGRWIYMENTHLNSEGSLLLAPLLQAALSEQLGIIGKD